MLHAIPSGLAQSSGIWKKLDLYPTRVAQKVMPHIFFPPSFQNKDSNVKIET